MMEILEVKNHTRDFGVRAIKHQADVKIAGMFTGDRKLVAKVSEKVGYHLAGYGLYDYSVERIGEDEYHVEWETSDSCD